MTIFGTIKSFDENSGSGTIAPEKGGEILAFARAAMPLKGEKPHEKERFSYEHGRDGFGKNCAVNLKRVEA